MTDKKVWLITGAGRGMGVDIAKAALAAGNAVVATGRNPDAVTNAVGKSDDLLAVKLDVKSYADAQAAVQAAVERFGVIDILVNNAGNFYAGFFEELTPEQMASQLTTTLMGPMNVTRAVLPMMRAQRSGHVITISSSAGLTGFQFGTAYAASKFGVEGWMESLRPEVEPFGIYTTIVNPGFFRTELLTPESTNFAQLAIDDYAERRAALTDYWTSQNGRQSGDPAKLAQALVTIDHRAAAATAVHRRRRLDRFHRAEGRRPAGRHRPESRALHLARRGGGLTMARSRADHTMRAANIDVLARSRSGTCSYPIVAEPTDAVGSRLPTCVCGGGPLAVPGESPFEPGPIGHEFVGVVEDVGQGSRPRDGDLVIAPTAYCDGNAATVRRASRMPAPRAVSGRWRRYRRWSGRGGPRALRRRHAVRVRGSGIEATMRSLLALSDVMGTGHHAARARRQAGSAVAVVGDGAVGLCAISLPGVSAQRASSP